MSQIDQAYATAEEYRGVVKKTDAGSDSAIARHLKACSRFYDRITGEFWGLETPAVARIWEGGSNCLRVKGGRDLCPGIADVSGMIVQLDTNLNGTYATTLTSGQFECHPLNAAFGPDPQPFTEIVIPRWSTASYLSFPCDMRVKVTAIYGHLTVPDDVWSDVIELCGIWRGENPRSTGRISELDQLVTTSPMAMSLVKRFQRSRQNAVVA